MADWEITATTIYCEAVGDEVTVLVRGDLSTACTGCTKYGPANHRNGRKERKAACTGLDCAPVAAYREKLRAEEAGTK